MRRTRIRHNHTRVAYYRLHYEVMVIVKQVREVARQWVIEEASTLPGFHGAFFAGSINWLPDDAAFPPTSDVDVVVVLADASPPDKPGKFVYRDVLL